MKTVVLSGQSAIFQGKKKRHEFPGMVGVKMAENEMGYIRDRNSLLKESSHGPGPEIE
jgi:hypothetical protein